MCLNYKLIRMLSGALKGDMIKSLISTVGKGSKHHCDGKKVKAKGLLVLPHLCKIVGCEFTRDCIPSPSPHPIYGNAQEARLEMDNEYAGECVVKVVMRV